MFGRRSRRVNPFHGRSRSDREIVYGGQIWAFAVLVVLLAALTSPLWLLSPPSVLGTKQEFRMAGAAVWGGLAVLALFAGRFWGQCLSLNPDERTVSREQRTPWSVTTLWSFSGERIAYVSLSKSAQGISRLEVFLKDGSTVVVDKGVHEGNLRRLGDDLARCWGVPFNS